MTTIRRRCLSILLPGLAVVLLAGGAAVYWLARASLLRQLDDGLAARAEGLAALVTFDEGRLEFEFDEDPGGTVGEGLFEVRTPGGDLLRRSENLAGNGLQAPVAPDCGMAFADIRLPDGRAGRCASLAFQPRLDDPYDQPPAVERPVLVLATAVDRRPVDAALATLLGALLLVGGVVGATVGVLVAVGVRLGLAPLNRLTRRLGGVRGETISTRLDDPAAPRELAPVYRELNSMLDRVEQTLQRERSFADAAAHELRTPLAELRATAEVAAKWPDRNRAARSLTEVLSIGREMERLVESLLLISRGDAGTANGAVEKVSIGRIVQRCLQQAAPTIDRKRLRVAADARDDLSAAPGLQIVVRNLIDNAIRHTPAGGDVTIRTGPDDDGATVLVVENGPVDLTREDLPRLFEPFWRADQARCDRDHLGLGLTVVQRIVRAARLRLDTELAGDRLRIRVTTPAQAAPEPAGEPRGRSAGGS